MASRKKPSASRARASSRAREERRAEESAALEKASQAYSAALGILSEAVMSLNRGARALDLATASAAAPELVQYGVAARLRPADLRRVVHSASRDLVLLSARVRSSGLSVPDGSEEAYGRLVSGLCEASDLIVRSMEEFSGSAPRGAGRPNPAVRDLVLSASRAASAINRLVGRGRTSVSVHMAAVSAEISAGDVSFY